MLTNYVFMILIRRKTSEDIINAYLKHVYATFDGSKYILCDRGGELSSKQLSWLAKELGFTKVYTSPYFPTANTVIVRMHSFLKPLLLILIKLTLRKRHGSFEESNPQLQYMMLNIRLVIKSVNDYLARHLAYKIVHEISDMHLYDSYNYYTQLIRY